MSLEVFSFFDTDTSTLSHVIYAKNSRFALIVDPVMDFDLPRFKTRQTSVDKILRFCQEKNLEPTHVLETHAHADHMSGSYLLKAAYPKIKLGIGREISLVQKYFADLFDLGKDFACDGSQFDFLYEDGAEFDLGICSLKTWHTPGHTQACYTLEIEQMLFAGDLIFAPDLGTGRCDFPGGDASKLYRSVKNKLYTKPDAYTIYLAHDYPPEGRERRTTVSVGEQKQSNLRLNAQTTEAEFVKFRKERDAQLPPPKLLLPSLLVNIAGGKLPPPHINGRRYLTIPLDFEGLRS